ncbi:DUF1707 and DUF2154 domain-containing protein [Kibdelosporangium aridum]|uniref:DUF1707 and DUF2154 domain-containing protein n=1 Tax=Kibdelosporangium aridum TaxID=2030 RepID=A0A428ZUZ2_KIBAR|nr:DUF1707 domain-containing protein [Kibdelosporangium aridum]RSM91763.1 DUF1707 and DUF2154 domain-containing protein [Kibdelosporangium aridum]
MSGDLMIRLSDEERFEAVRVLDAAVADGRITWDEHAERTDLVWAAKTKGDLVPQLADLGPVAAQAEPAQRVVATISKVIRTPEATREVKARATFGAVVLNLTGMRPGEHTRVIADSFCGKVAVFVPENAVVIDEGTAVMGKRSIFGIAEGQGGPVVRISGRVTMGNIKVFRGEARHW